MAGMTDRAAFHPLTLRFLDTELEDRFQNEEGAEGVSGYRVIAAATVVLWIVAAALLPAATDIDWNLALTVGGAMALAGGVCLAASKWASTMNRQHALASLLTTANGLVIIVLADSAGVLEGYAVGAIMLLFVFAFVSRTRFVYAAMRTLAIGVGFLVAALLYEGDGSLIIDSFIYLAAGAGSLLGLRLMERNRRRLWHQRLVIDEQNEALAIERAESERLLLNVLPAAVSRRLKNGEHPIADSYPVVSILFADIVGFTGLASTMSSGEVIMMLSGLFSHFDDLVVERELEKIKTSGDSYMAVGGLPDPLEDHADRVVDLALAMLACTLPGGPYDNLKLRLGVHSGPASGGVIGSRKFAYDVWGDSVNIAARLEEAGVPGRVHVSEETKLLADRSYRFESRGPTELKGLGTRNTFLVVEALGRPTGL